MTLRDMVPLGTPNLQMSRRLFIALSGITISIVSISLW